MSQTAARRLDVLHRLSREVARATAPEDIYRAALDGLALALGTDRASILLFDADGVIRFTAWRGLSDAYRRAVEGHSPWPRGAAGAAPLLVPNALADAALAPFRDTIAAEGIRALAFIPLVGRDGAIGTLMLYYAAPRAFADDDVKLAETIAHQIGFAIERTATEDALQRKDAERQLAQDENLRLLARIDAERTRIRNIVASVPGVVWEAWGEPDAAAQRIDFVSDYVEPLLGHRVEEWLSTPNFWLTIVHPDDRARAAQVAADAFRTGQPHTNEFRWIARDGRVVWVEAHSSMIFDEHGRPAGMRGVTMDVTARKRAEAERGELLAREQAARAEAEAAGRLKDEFLATLSHELRTPLNAILGWADLLRQGKLDGGRRENAIGSIVRNAHALAELVSDILDVSTIITGKLRLDIQRVEVVPLVASVLESLRPAAQAKGIALACQFDPTAGSTAADAVRLQQIVWNLLSNAIKFTPHGGQVEVRVARAGGELEVAVSDTGIGIQPEFLPWIFQRFRQADSSTTRAYTGLGLGLSIVRHLTEVHGGTVAAESAGEGHGAVFTVRMPIVTPAAPGAGGPPALAGAPRGPSTPPVDLSSLDILVVEDTADARELIETCLARQGARVTLAASAAEGLQALAARRFDLVIADIGMPHEDGYVFIRRLRALGAERGGGVPAIALTAYARDEDRDRALASGYQIHLAKPVEPAALLRAIEAMTSRPGR